MLGFWESEYVFVETLYCSFLWIRFFFRFIVIQGVEYAVCLTMTLAK